MLNDWVLLVRKDAFLRSLAEDSDIWISFSWALLEGILLRLDLISGVMPLMKRWKTTTTSQLQHLIEMCGTVSFMVNTYILETPPLRGHVVDGIARDPEHGGQGHDEAHDVRLQRIFHTTVLYRHPFETIKQEDRLKERASSTLIDVVMVS